MWIISHFAVRALEEWQLQEWFYVMREGERSLQKGT